MSGVKLDLRHLADGGKDPERAFRVMSADGREAFGASLDEALVELAGQMIEASERPAA